MLLELASARFKPEHRIIDKEDEERDTLDPITLLPIHNSTPLYYGGDYDDNFALEDNYGEQ